MLKTVDDYISEIVAMSLYDIIDSGGVRLKHYSLHYVLLLSFRDSK